MSLLVVSGSPHVHSGLSVRKLMWGVIIALLPALLASYYFFGLGAVLVSFTAVVSAMLFEYLIARFILKIPLRFGGWLGHYHRFAAFI